jgi:7,8-dihydropterin-6-yl-methyl-4-(beta-D-ribofuranosyl)aminobenzene 5'-phosphate synthase
MKIIFDNYNYGSSCKSLWGFSIYLDKYKLLFDTGSNGRVLLQNMLKLNIDIKEIKYIFLTHSHWDHIGGIDSILELNSDITIFAPLSLSKHLVDDLRILAKEVIICTKESKKLLDGVYTTGLLGKQLPEQSLIIDDEEPKLISGCGHFGIHKIISSAKYTIQKDIDFVIGGFHLLDKEKDDILQSINTLQNLGVKKVLPTHCTGDLAIKLYAQYFKKNYIQGGVGKII